MRIGDSRANAGGAYFGAGARPPWRSPLAPHRSSRHGGPNARVNDLCRELGIIRQTLYSFVGPKGEFRADGDKLLKRKGKTGPHSDA
jgi:hypothetical protein